MELVLGRFSHFNIAIAYSRLHILWYLHSKFLWVHFKTVKISGKRAHPWKICFKYLYPLFLKALSLNAQKQNFEFPHVKYLQWIITNLYFPYFRDYVITIVAMYTLWMLMFTFTCPPRLCLKDEDVNIICLRKLPSPWLINSPSEN